MKNLTDFYQKNKDGNLFFINFAIDKTLKIAGYGILKVLLLIFFMGIFVSANGQQLQNYDLAFGAFDDCKVPQVDVKITDMDNPEWTVDYLQVYIKYTVTGGQNPDDFFIDEERTRYFLNNIFKNSYKPYYNNSQIVNFTKSQDGQTGMILIEGKLKDGYTRQELESMQDLITIYYNKAFNSQVTDVKFEFLYELPNNSEINLYDEQDISHVCIPKSNDISTTYNFETVGFDYDLTFSDVGSEVNMCDLKHTDVLIDECNNYDLKVKVLRVYINCNTTNGSFDIDDDLTKENLNQNLKDYFEPDSDNGEIVKITENTNNIEIEAKLKDGIEAPTLNDIKRIITIYFTGEPSSSVEFSFFYKYPNPESVMLLQNGTDCFMSYPNQLSDKKICDYTFPASMVKNYDLAFGQVDFYLQDPDVTCKSSMVPIDVISIDNPQWEIKSIKVYIKYDKDLVIDENKTDEFLRQKIKNNYNYTFSSTNRMLSFEASIKSGADKITFDEIDDEHLFTMFFSGKPGEAVNIEFSYDMPASLMNANDANNQDDCIMVYPKQNTTPIENYPFEGDYLIGIVSTWSNGEMKGRCNGPNGSNVGVMEGVKVKYYNMDKDPNTPYCESTTGSDGIFGCYVSPDCTKRIVPEKEICNECGFTLQDINKIRRVILGIDDEFDFAYQTFVADMNGNGTVTTLDIVYIAKMMLVKELNLNGYTDFKFIPAKDFIKFQNEGFYGLGVPNYNSYIEFDTPPYFVTFYAFKTGDVVKDEPGDLGCDHCNPDCFVPKNPKPIRKEGIKEDNGTTGSIHEIDLNIEESEDYFYITGSTSGKDSFSLIGAAINIEPAGLEIDTVLFYDLEDEMPGYNYEKETGIIKLLWTNKNSYTSNLSTTGNLFKIILKKGKYNKADLNFSLVENNKLNYCIKNNSETYKTVLGEKIEERSDNIKQEFSIYPTLFDDKIYIKYYSSHTTQANLQLYDLQGRILLQKEFEAIEGSNTKIVKSLQNIPVGVVFYKVEINGNVYTGKIIKSEKSTNPYSE